MKSFHLAVFLLIYPFCVFGFQEGYQTWVTDPRYSMFPTLPIVVPESKNEVCRAHSKLFIQSLKNKTQWAMHLWDSSAKVPSGVLSGQVFHYGNFDGCLKIEAPFNVQYCLGHLVSNISLRYYDFREVAVASPSSNVWVHIAKSRLDPSKVPRDFLGWGLCVPASCKTSDLQNAINSHLKSFSEEFFNDTTFRIHLSDNFCTQKTEFTDFTAAEICFWVFLFSLVLLTTSSSLMDFIQKEKEIKPSKAYNLWMLFSIKQNYSRLFPLEERTKSFLDVFHGVKVVSILFIVYGHRIGISLSLSALNYDEIEGHFIQDHKMFFFQSDLVVDTFFFISGLLACYFMMNLLSKHFINPLHAIAVRIFRLAPMYFFVLWYQSTAAFRLGSGPLWKGLAKNETQYCVKHWWTNVLFISNYINIEEMCMPHSWFLPCEIHFFIIATLLIPILMKYKIFGRILLGIITFGFIITPAIIIYIHKIKPLILFYFRFLSQPRKNESFNLLYVRSHNRAAVYFIGMATGLFLYHTKDSKKRISMKLTLCGVLGWFAFLFAPMVYGSLYYDLNKPYNILESAIFGSLRRVSWAVAFSIFIVTHRFGTIPIIDLFFSSKLAVLFSRLTYGIYLIHFGFVTSDILTNRTPTVFSVHDLIIIGIGDILKSTFLTLIVTFILEIPLKRFFKEYLIAKKVKDLEQPLEIKNVISARL